MFRRVLLILGSALLLIPAATAQDLTSAAEESVSCLDVEGKTARLTCFETAAAKLSAGLEVGIEAEAVSASQADVPDWAEAPVVEPEDEADRTPVWARVLPRRDASDAPSEINITVERILRNTAGRHFFITDDGQEWEQTMAEGVRPPESLPARATVEESLVGSPRLTFDEGPSGAYKVRRVK